MIIVVTVIVMLMVNVKVSNGGVRMVAIVHVVVRGGWYDDNNDGE